MFYGLGQRTLADTLVGSSVKTYAVKDVEEEDIHVPEEIEAVVGLLLQGVLDKDTIVRWSAAKGLARLCERLPRDFAEQIVDSVVDLFALDCLVSGDASGVNALGEVAGDCIVDIGWFGFYTYIFIQLLVLFSLRSIQSLYSIHLERHPSREKSAVSWATA